MTHRLISELDAENEFEDAVIERLRDWSDVELNTLEAMMTERLAIRD